VLHPAGLGFVAGTAAFWLWGLAVDAGEFWQSHLRIHYVDRLLYHNPLQFGGYPTRTELWVEFWQHTGYVLLPMGLAALVVLAAQKGNEATARAQAQPDSARPLYSPGLWLTWAFLTAVVFTLVDWRQTKHLTPLLLALVVAPAYWSALGIGGRTTSQFGGVRLATPVNSRRWKTVVVFRQVFDSKRVGIVATILLGLTAWNLYTLYRLAEDFSVLPITPAW
jgi:hypothetical protein